MPVVHVPRSDAPIDDIWRFATTYFGYDRHGGVAGLGRLANDALARWKQAGELPSSDRDLRAALFFEARRWHHFGYPIDADSEAYVRGLVEQLIVTSGGSVRVDRHGLTIWMRRTRNYIRRPD